jgi:tartrate dehydrogenase/decarboxylase/D-malate dehydrogenase
MVYHKIAVIPGDGIGIEVVPEGLRSLDAAAARFGFELEFRHFDWSCQTYLSTHRMMPEDGLKQLEGFDAIYFGAVGFPGVPDHISFWGLLLPIRRGFDQYVNLRPVKLLPGIQSPLAHVKAGDIDFVVIRENTEGEYTNLGGRMYEGTDREVVIQESVFSRYGTDRIFRYAFEWAKREGRKRVTLATKSNGIAWSMPFCDERFDAIAVEYPTLETEKYHIDILTAHFVKRPQHFDVVVGSNLFGDILSDLGPAVCGGIGIAASANLNPDRCFPSLFEPVHGSAHDIAGQGIANPIGQIWSGALMLRHLGEEAGASAIERAINEVLSKGEIRTPDLGGTASTSMVGHAIASAVARV